jgi:hypothetical protein
LIYKMDDAFRPQSAHSVNVPMEADPRVSIGGQKIGGNKGRTKYGTISRGYYEYSPIW